MRNGRSATLNAAVFFALFVVLSSCASVDTNLLQDDELTITTESPPEVVIVVKKVYQDGEFLEISGTVWWDRESPFSGDSGHIDVEVENADGAVAGESNVELHRIFVRSGVRGRARFSARVGSPIGEGVTARLIFHQGVHHETTSESRLHGSARGNGGSNE